MLRRHSLQYSASRRSQIADGLDMSVKAGAEWPAHILNARIVKDRSSCSHINASNVTTVAAAGVKVRYDGVRLSSNLRYKTSGRNRQCRAQAAGARPSALDTESHWQRLVTHPRCGDGSCGNGSGAKEM